MLIDAIRSGDFGFLLCALPILLLSLTVHELCHGLMAYALGDDTAKSMGRLSLNPLKHIDPIGFIVMLVAGFGWAKPVQVDTRRMRKPKRDFALTAMAGPLSNFCMASLSAAVMLLLMYFSELGPDSWVYEMLNYALAINVGLGVFNLLPIPPLDGSRLLGAFLPDRLYAKYLQLGRFGMFILMALSMAGGFSNFLPRIIEFVVRTMWDIQLKLLLLIDLCFYVIGGGVI